ncbi:hypothetical protein PVNG_02386 [Plasmodium vivax North Korean]|uniref:AAA+ ATPase domain-containing protein n=1 Tax=Plasmodium vivax North Korean TaxID=1035514 RepID=A0A0J9W6P3_PLAVI|nr:hypothetical protein PVNG_02386 [Plasmodium vivax North Korean]
MLYNQHRPKTFKELFGQIPTKDLLINILKKRINVHSFIFYGPNGTGKTTSARLFARAINCQNFSTLGDICRECTNCKISESSNCPDILEIDGATHNGVEYMKEVIKSSSYPPLQLDKKLYIVDESHCLNHDSSILLENICKSDILESMKILCKNIDLSEKLFLIVLKKLLELAFYKITSKKECLTLLEQEEAEKLIKILPNLESIINFLSPILSSGKFSNTKTYCKYILLNLCKNSHEPQVHISIPEERPKQEKTKEKESSESIYNKKILSPGELLSESITQLSMKTSIPPTSQLFNLLTIHFISFQMPDIQFNETIEGEAETFNILQNTRRENSNELILLLSDYLESEQADPFVSSLFDSLHPKYKLICTEKSCLAIFNSLSKAQYFNLKLRQLNLQLHFLKIFRKKIQ